MNSIKKEKIVPSADRDARTTVKELLSFIEKQGQADYMGEAVSQLEHSLQAATLAENAGADHETILGALLHDVGRFIPAAEKMENMITADGTYIGKASHEILGERYLRQLGFSEKVCQVVGAHVVAKRYLCAVEKGYWESLSKSSKQTLEFQGGVFTEEEVAKAQQDAWLESKLAVRRWDDKAKDPNRQTLPLEHFEEMMVRALVKSRSEAKVGTVVPAMSQTAVA